MGKNVKLSLFVLISLLLLVAYSFAEEGEQPQLSTPATVAAASPATQGSAKAQTTRKSEGITWGYDERFRFDAWNNSDWNGKLEDENRQLKFRTRVFLNVPFGNYVDAYVRLGNEAIKKTADPTAAHDGPSAFRMNEIWFDNAYLNFKKLPIKGLSLQVGRQDFRKGDGFIIFTDAPLHGARSVPNNMFDLTYKYKKQTLELFGMYNPKFDEFFPIINGDANTGSTIQGKQYGEWDSLGTGLYYTNNQYKNTDIEGYYIFKKEYNDYRARTNYLYQPDRHFSTIGGRFVQRFGTTSYRQPSWKIVGEFAGEIGTQDSMNAAFANTPIHAWGGFTYVKKRFDVKFHPWVLVDFTAMSGSDPNNPNTIGAFDPVYSRWAESPSLTDKPDWSSIYIYSQNGHEVGIGYYSNSKMTQVEAGFFPIPQIEVVLGYGHWSAFYPFSMNPYHLIVNPIATPASVTSYFSSGDNRMDQYRAKFKYTITKDVYGYVGLEKVLPGSFYKGKDNGIFFRTEVNYRYSGLVPMPWKKK
jgi:hypothetical protein